MSKKFEAYVKRALRKLFAWWPPRAQARRRQEVSKGWYACNICAKIFHRSATHVDHIEPVVIPGIVSDWNGYIERLYCSVENLQVLCKGCHAQKTKKENAERSKVRRRQARPKSS